MEEKGDTGTTAATGEQWWAGFDDETKGYITARGLDKKPINEVVADTIKAHRNAEAKLGVPADRMVQWPADGDAEGMKKIWAKLGTPQDPTGYDFAAVKTGDGKDPDMEFVNFLRQTAFDLNLPANSGQELAKRILARTEKLATDQGDRAKVEQQAAIANGMAQLKMNWGTNEAVNQFIAQRAAEQIGLTAAELNAMSGTTVGYPKLMEGLRKLGVAMGEGKLLGVHDSTGGNRILTREEAISKKAELMQDRDFISRWGKADSAALNELSNLDKIIVGPPPAGR